MGPLTIKHYGGKTDADHTLTDSKQQASTDFSVSFLDTGEASHKWLKWNQTSKYKNKIINHQMKSSKKDLNINIFLDLKLYTKIYAVKFLL